MRVPALGLEKNIGFKYRCEGPGNFARGYGFSPLNKNSSGVRQLATEMLSDVHGNAVQGATVPRYRAREHRAQG